MKKYIFIYDFDGTCTIHNMPVYEALTIAKITGINASFKAPEVLELMETKGCDKYAAWWEYYTEKMKSVNLFTKEGIVLGADKVEFSSGILKMLEVLNANGIRNIILTSGVKEFIEYTKVMPYIDEVYGTSFDFTTKEPKINFVSDIDKLKIIKEIRENNPNCNIVYFGDGMTDRFAFKEMNSRKGDIAIFIRNSNNDEALLELEAEGLDLEVFENNYMQGTPLYTRCMELANIG